MTVVNNAVGVQRTEAFLEKLQQLVAEAMPELTAELQAVVLAKAPTPDEEYAALMVGEGGGSYDIPSLAGDQSADNDPEAPGRVRFMKAPGTFIADVTASPENILCGDTYASIGNHALLLESSTYQFKDYTPKKKKAGGDYQSGAFTVGPYFDAFEYGSANIGTWSETVTPRGSGYPLRPDDNPRHRPMSMNKPILARFMYEPTELQLIARRFLDGLLANDGSTSTT